MEIFGYYFTIKKEPLNETLTSFHIMKLLLLNFYLLILSFLLLISPLSYVQTILKKQKDSYPSLPE